MRILQVVHGYPPEKRGGAELVTASLAQALAQRGHQVTVFARTADTAAAEFSVRQDAPDTDGVRVVRVVNNLSHASHFRLEYDHPFLDAAFQRVLTDTRPEVVHVQHVIHCPGVCCGPQTNSAIRSSSACTISFLPAPVSIS